MDLVEIIFQLPHSASTSLFYLFIFVRSNSLAASVVSLHHHHSVYSNIYFLSNSAASLYCANSVQL